VAGAAAACFSAPRVPPTTAKWLYMPLCALAAVEPARDFHSTWWDTRAQRTVVGMQQGKACIKFTGGNITIKKLGSRNVYQFGSGKHDTVGCLDIGVPITVKFLQKNTNRRKHFGKLLVLRKCKNRTKKERLGGKNRVLYTHERTKDVQTNPVECAVGRESPPYSCTTHSRVVDPARPSHPRQEQNKILNNLGQRRHRLTATCRVERGRPLHTKRESETAAPLPRDCVRP